MDSISKITKKNITNINDLEGWLWKAACTIRGPVDAPKFKDYILPLIFLRRLSDVFDDEVDRLAEEFGSKEKALKLIEKDRTLVRFYIPEDSKWDKIKTLSEKVGEELTTKIRDVSKTNLPLQGVIDIVDYNATVSGQRIIEDGRLISLITILSDPRFRLGLTDVEPDFLGRAYEYLLRKFAEGQGQSAGEFFTPKEVGWLIASLLNPEEQKTVYDPTCGSGGLLIKSQLFLKEKIGKKVQKPLQLFGQETNPTTYAIAKMNMIIHDMDGMIGIGDSLKNPKFLDKKSGIQKFNFVAANPMWRQPEYDSEFYENDPFNRFDFGYPTQDSADWGWVQHMLCSLEDDGKAVIVLDAGAVSRGSGNQGTNKEKNIRKEMVDHDLIEGVILLPENLFYNTNAPGILLILNKSKSDSRKDKIVLVNASNHFKKGKPKNFIPDNLIKKITDGFNSKKNIKNFVKIILKDDAIENDYNLIPSLYVNPENIISYGDISSLISDLIKQESENIKLLSKVKKHLKKIGYEWSDNGDNK
jgi:type I restriction enzyme M protein